MAIKLGPGDALLAATLDRQSVSGQHDSAAANVLS
jgi:hypothetical protein